MKKNINPFVVPLSCIFAPLLGPEPVIKGDHFSLGSAVFQALKPITRTNYVQRKLLKNVAICTSIKDKQVSLKNNICCYIGQKVEQESGSNFVFREGGRLSLVFDQNDFLSTFWLTLPYVLDILTKFVLNQLPWLRDMRKRDSIGC